jgi:KUP system potassium uptake protein
LIIRQSDILSHLTIEIADPIRSREPKTGTTRKTQKATFFLGREIIIPSAKPGMARWREHLFSFASKLAQQPATYFQIPVGRVIELGQQVEI